MTAMTKDTTITGGNRCPTGTNHGIAPPWDCPPNVRPVESPLIYKFITKSLFKISWCKNVHFMYKNSLGLILAAPGCTYTRPWCCAKAGLTPKIYPHTRKCSGGAVENVGANRLPVSESWSIPSCRWQNWRRSLSTCKPVLTIKQAENTRTN